MIAYGDSSKPWWCERNAHIGLDAMKPKDLQTLLGRSNLLSLLRDIQMGVNTGYLREKKVDQIKALAEKLGFPLDLLEQTIAVGQAESLRAYARLCGTPEELVAKVEPHPDLAYLL